MWCGNKFSFTCDVKINFQAYKSSDTCTVKAHTPAQAKRIAQEMPFKDHSEWNMKKISVMRNVLTAKAESSDKFKSVLINSQDKILVEATRNEFWRGGGRSRSSTGHDHRHTKITR